MSQQLILLLVTVLLPSLNAFTVFFDGKIEAEYELMKVKDENSLELLQGCQAIVRFAKVISSPEGYVFKAGDEVALKIGFANKSEQMHREQAAHDIIRKNGYIDGVVKAEKFLGHSIDLRKDGNLFPPTQMAKQGKFLILVMERMGMDLQTKFEISYDFTKNELEAIYDQLCVILGQLKTIEIVHGDVKPPNILFKNSKLVTDGIKLGDFGLAHFKGSGVRFAGDLMYMSPIQESTKRVATFNDADVSGAYSIIFIATGYLPWLEFMDDLKCDQSEQLYDLHEERIMVAKYEFNMNPFGKFPTIYCQLSTALKQKISDTIKRATEHEVGNIEMKIEGFRKAIKNSVKNG